MKLEWKSAQPHVNTIKFVQEMVKLGFVQVNPKNALPKNH